MVWILKVEDECKLGSLDEIAAAVHEILGRIQEEAGFSWYQNWLLNCTACLPSCVLAPGRIFVCNGTWLCRHCSRPSKYIFESFLAINRISANFTYKFTDHTYCCCDCNLIYVGGSIQVNQVQKHDGVRHESATVVRVSIIIETVCAPRSCSIRNK